MKYFKNTELAKLYNVSEKSVRNWIQASLDGKLELTLYSHNEKSYVANVSRNTLLIEQLVRRGKKYKNTRGTKAINPKPAFYEVYSQNQIFDIISSLTTRHEVPLKYSYADGGAKYWDKYANRLAEEETPNILTKTIELLDATFTNVMNLIGEEKLVNVVDLGPGNGLPIRSTLSHLLKQGRLKRYIAIDSSQEMLNIAERNLKEWFGDEVKFEGYVRDFGHERFDDLFADDYAGDDEDIPANLVFLLGGTLSNFRSPSRTLQTINYSLGSNGLLLYGDKLDTPATRRYFDFNITPHSQKLTPRHRLILDYLNVEESYYDVEQSFDESKRARSIKIIPKVDLLVNFEMSKGTRRVELRKNHPILLWRSWDWGSIEVVNQFDQNGFELMQLVRAKEQEYILMLLKLKIEE